MVGCDICDKEFKRRDNMLRHKKTVHGGENFDKIASRQELDSSDESTKSESDMEMAENEETVDPWHDIIEHTYRILQPDFDTIANELLAEGDMSEKEARKKAFEELLPKYRKQLTDKYLFRVLWFDSMKDDPIHVAIKRTLRRLVEEDDYEREEAWKYATNKRKYLFDKLFKAYDLPDLHESD